MDIQAVESKLSDVTVTPIPRSQVQNFYNYQQQREQREQQPQIQISAIHHVPRDRNGERDHHGHTHQRTNELIREAHIYQRREREREYHTKLNSSSPSAAAVAAAATALQYSQLQQQLQAQLALLQQQSNTTASPAASIARAAAAAANSNNHLINLNAASQLKYPAQCTSPVVITTQTSANITTPLTSTANLSSLSNGSNGLSKYAQLLNLIEEMGRDIRPTYTGSRSSTERLKRGIVHARILVRECLMETERSARQ